MRVKYVIRKALGQKESGISKLTPPGVKKLTSPGLNKLGKGGGGKQGLQLLPSKTNPNVKRWEQTQQKQPNQQQNKQNDPSLGVREPYAGKHSGAQVGHRINYHGNGITITGVGEHGVTARDQYGRKYELFHHELRRKGK